MSNMVGLFDLDEMDHVLPMGPQEQSQYLADLRQVVDADRLEEFLLGLVLDAHACGYQCRIDDECA